MHSATKEIVGFAKLTKFEDIPEEVVEKTKFLILDPLGSKKVPRSSYDAKFSLPYCIASILVRGTCNVDNFSEGAINDSEVLKVASLFSYEEDPSQDFLKYFPESVEIIFDSED